MIVRYFTLIEFFENFFSSCKAINIVVIAFLFYGFILLCFVLLIKEYILSNYFIL
jgi:hypothetical protein